MDARQTGKLSIVLQGVLWAERTTPIKSKQHMEHLKGWLKILRGSRLKNLYKECTLGNERDDRERPVVTLEKVYLPTFQAGVPSPVAYEDGQLATK